MDNSSNIDRPVLNDDEMGLLHMKTEYIIRIVRELVESIPDSIHQERLREDIMKIPDAIDKTYTLVKPIIDTLASARLDMELEKVYTEMGAIRQQVDVFKNIPLANVDTNGTGLLQTLNLKPINFREQKAIVESVSKSLLNVKQIGVAENISHIAVRELSTIELINSKI